MCLAQLRVASSVRPRILRTPLVDILKLKSCGDESLRLPNADEMRKNIVVPSRTQHFESKLSDDNRLKAMTNQRIG
jgi:hypothetical protein